MKPKLFFLLLLTFSIFHITSSIATVRYVSTTGNNISPFLSWENASTSIQICINICDTGDTIYVANGVYYESIYIDKTINLLGSSSDSTIIDGTGTPNNYIIYFFENNSSMKNFKITSPSTPKTGLASFNTNLQAENCIIGYIYLPISIANSSVIIERFVIYNFSNYGLRDECPSDTCKSKYSENILISNSGGTSVYFTFGGTPTFINNIVLEEGITLRGIDIRYHRGAFVRNNLVSGFRQNNLRAGEIRTDTAYFENNNSVNSSTGIGFATSTAHRTKIRNNIIKGTSTGINSSNGTVIPDYNLFWNNNTNSSGTAVFGNNNIIANPMFVNDTLPTLSGTYDLHLQKYSPAIDAGDPSILDIDGSRSDIGMFGGPLGQRYTYQDLAPKPPHNLTASLDSGLVHLKWNKNTEADLFRYRVYRDTVPDFIYDTTKIITVLADTFYYDDVPDKFNAGSYYYKTTAIDSAINQSAASEEVHVIITGIPEAPPVVVEHYKLLQNYPNPFNPTTTIPYRLKEPGYVKVMVYNIVGELVRVLVNGYQGSGYYEVEFNPNQSERKKAEGYIEFETGYYGNVASGIYLYRIEVIGEGRIPRFSDMKKMILLK